MNMLHLKPEAWAAISAVCAVVCCVCTVVALFISMRNSGLARKALQLSERSFAIEKRPFITMNPVRSTKTGKYINLTSNESGFVLELGYEVRNSGASPAQNLSVPRILRLSGPGNWQFTDIAYDVPPRISLGPQEARVMLLRADLKVSDPAAPDKLLDANEEDKVVITVRTALNYRSEYFAGTQFSVTATHRISKERAETLAYDFDSKGADNGTGSF